MFYHVHTASFSEFKKWSPRVRMLGVQLPPFHAMGLCVQLTLPLYLCATIAIFPPVVTAPHMLPMAPTPDSILEHTQRTKSSCALTIPAFLQIWAQDKHALEILSSMDYVVCFLSLGDNAIVLTLSTELRWRWTEPSSRHHPQRTRCPTSLFLWRNGIRRHCHVQPSGWRRRRLGLHRVRRHLHSSLGSPGRWNIRIAVPGEHLCLTNVSILSDALALVEPQSLLVGRKLTRRQRLWYFRFVQASPDKTWFLEDVRHHTNCASNYLLSMVLVCRSVGRVDDVIIHSSGEKTVPAPMEALMASSPQYVFNPLMENCSG